jgi:segregation and condensation protein B
MIARSEMAAALEAVLFVSARPVPRARLLEMFDEADRAEAALALEEVLGRYGEGEGRGVQAEEVAGGVRLVTRPELHGWLRRFFEVAAGTRLSMAALETLAIVAYRQPVTAPEIQELRSVNPAGVLKTLLERRLLRIAGRKEVVGKPFLYTTTREFLVHFGLKDLKDLPPLEELEEALALESAGGDGAAESMAGGEESAAAGGGRPGATAPEDGEDREETILRRAAELEEADDDSADDEESAAVRSARQDEAVEKESAAASGRQGATAPVEIKA